MNSNEPVLFLKSFLQSPKHVGSIIPSSRFLASKMVKQASWLEAKAVAELDRVQVLSLAIFINKYRIPPKSYCLR